MKGMLTEPVTILQWSFVRNDQAAGFYHHFLKPFPLKDLDAALEKAMSEVTPLATN